MKRLFVLICLALALANRAEAQSSGAGRVLTLINQARAGAGLAPFAMNSQLTAAAQGHADDMARNGVGIGHGGSDGSTPTTRILRAGYPAYSWGPEVGENWAAFQTIEASMSAWMSDASHRDNILSAKFREIGIGTAVTSTGDPILVADFGAQPNVLPVFIAGSGSSVTLILTNELAAPAGDGPQVIGTAVSVDLAPGPDFSNARSQPFAGSVNYASPDGSNVVSVYVRFHDAQGRTAVSVASPAGGVVAPAALAVRTPAPKPTTSPVRRATATRQPTRRPLPPRTKTPTPTATSTDTPTVTPTATARAAPRLRRAVATVVPIGTTVNAVSAGPNGLWLAGCAALFAAGVLLLAGSIAILRLGRRT